MVFQRWAAASRRLRSSSSRDHGKLFSPDRPETRSSKGIAHSGGRASGAYRLGTHRRRKAARMNASPSRVQSLSLAAVAALAVATLAAAPVFATPTTYTLSATGAYVPTGGSLTLSGSFTYDPTTNTDSAISITATSPTSPSLLSTSPEDFNAVNTSYANELYLITSTSHDYILVDFNANLSPAASDPITEILVFDEATHSSYTLGDITGDASPLAVPEPRGFALLSGALCLLFLLCRRLNRRSQPA